MFIMSSVKYANTSRYGKCALADDDVDLGDRLKRMDFLSSDLEHYFLPNSGKVMCPCQSTTPPYISWYWWFKLQDNPRLPPQAMENATHPRRIPHLSSHSVAATSSLRQQPMHVPHLMREPLKISTRY